MRSKTFRKAALCMALGACLGAIAPSAMAQQVTGAVAGRATAGDQISVTHRATGLTRTATVSSDGSYRLGQLPVGDYQLQTLRDGRPVGEPVTVNVALGGTTTVNLGSGGGVANLAAVEVVGSRVVNRVDVFSTESSTNITREEFDRLPVAQSLSSVALLAPGVLSGNSSFGGISFGGSSVAENSVFINGLNVTDFYRRQSFSTAPFAFFEQFQVKTGGYSVEFGRSTGGVINAVTRSGTNELEGGVEITFEPEAWRADFQDRYYDDGTVNTRGSRDRQTFTKANVWASGPLIRDRLFLFAMYEQRENDARNTNSVGSSWSESSNNDGFWGAKMDWNINDNHLVELLAFSDETETDVDSYAYGWDSGGRGAFSGARTNESGGKSGSVTYTAQLTENFSAKAMYGINRSSSFSRSPNDGLCDWVTYNSASYASQYRALGSPVLGCHPGATVVSHEDERKASRLDFEWALGDHLLRFGVDHELMTTDRSTFYPGNGMQYTAYGRTSATQVLDNGTALPTGVNQFLMARERADGGVFDITASAFYLEDMWSVTPNLLLNLGLRVDNFNNKNAVGDSFIKLDELVSPRVGFSWDVKGDSTTKLFGNLGRYYMPIPSIISYNFAGGLLDERTFYVLEGWRDEVNPVTGATYKAPIIGAQIGPVDQTYNIVVNDTRQSVDQDLEAVYQDEAILGFQQAISQAWSWGVNATYRRMKNTIDDIRINQTACGPIWTTGNRATGAPGTPTGTIFPIGNPGRPLTLWGSSEGDPNQIRCAEDGWITVDTATEGYRTGGTNRIVGYFEPKRTYKSLEFQIDRAWDGKWQMNASYLWSKLDGNHEGPVNSDTNYGDTGMVQHWDHPANNQDYGPLFNDRRHQFKLRGSYAPNEIWTFGASFTAMSGAPINQFGVTWPGDTTAAGSVTSEGSGGGSFWHCIPPAGLASCASVPVNDRVYEYAGRGSGGRMPWTYNLGASVTWTLPVEGVDLKARLSVFNLLNDQEVINVRQRYEANPGQVRPYWGTGTRWQSPRYTQLVITWNF
ncbi:energy transducer TonB [Lysobacteraceae bacterium NML91-0213]|nr:energy transducer TonB [Xanthomonadaceae bacterium NML91-0213]